MLKKSTQRRRALFCGLCCPIILHLLLKIVICHSSNVLYFSQRYKIKWKLKTESWELRSKERFARDLLFGDSRDNRDNRDNREIYYHSDDTLFRSGLFRLCGLYGLKKKTSQVQDPNFLGEVVRCGTSRKKPSRDSTPKYSPGWFTFRDVPQIAAYREKLISCQKGSDLALTRKLADGTY